MEERSDRNRRILAVAAATCISLACGTNYAYSAWAPQFAEKLQLSATQSNLIVGIPEPLKIHVLRLGRGLLGILACMPPEYHSDTWWTDEVPI
jgi:hypothetical protein